VLVRCPVPRRFAKLLIVDEDDATRIALNLIFSELGYVVRTSVDGVSGLAEIRKEIPDFLLANLNMVRIPGKEFLEVVRRWLPSIRVIAMADVSPKSRVAPGVAADAFFRKGADPARLIKVVDSMTQERRSTIRQGLPNSFGFRVTETIPYHPRIEQLMFPAIRASALPIAQKEKSRRVSAVPDVIQARAVGF